MNDSVSVLLGVVIGGAITGYTTWLLSVRSDIERRRHDARLEERRVVREAIAWTSNLKRELGQAKDEAGLLAVTETMKAGIPNYWAILKYEEAMSIAQDLNTLATAVTKTGNVAAFHEGLSALTISMMLTLSKRWIASINEDKEYSMDRYWHEWLGQSGPGKVA